MLTVVAALIESRGKILTCQRRRGDAFELMWEFPGGKVKPGETLEKALARELREELGVTAQIGREVYRVHHEYAVMGAPIELVFFAAELDSVEIQNLAFEEICWCEPRFLTALNFLPADRKLVEKLANGSLHVPPLR